MKHIRRLALVVLVASLGLLTPQPSIAAAVEGPGGAAEQGSTGLSPGSGMSSASPDQRAQSEPDKQAPVYKPPLRGAPAGRLGGGTRGVGQGSLTVSVLVPDHPGLTSQEQPSLYWFLSQPTSYPLELTVIEAQAAKPLLETRISQGGQPGVKGVRLAEFGVRLKTGVPYQWFVAVVVDPEQRSRDIVDGGEIERVDLDKALKTKLEQAGKAGAPHCYAEAGFWYDALAALSEAIAAAPANADLRRQRAALLRQVGLTAVADYELKQ